MLDIRRNEGGTIGMSLPSMQPFENHVAGPTLTITIGDYLQPNCKFGINEW